MEFLTFMLIKVLVSPQVTIKLSFNT